MKLQTSIIASLEVVSKFTASLESDLDSLPLETRTGIILAIQELLVNIVEHAYAGTSGEIDFMMHHSETLITITVTEHSGSTFTLPETINDPDPFALPESGLGLFIIMQAFDNVDYAPVPDGNRWKLTKRLEA